MFAPKIVAQFELDSAGKPKAVVRGSTKHYSIRLHLASPPEDTYAVTYQLHPSYYDPVRESHDRASSFSSELTSYGDYTINAKVRTKQGVIAVTFPLSEALKEGHASSMSTPIASALSDIESK
jgi:hypothetical protein